MIQFEITEDDTQEKLTERIVKLSQKLFWSLKVGKYEMTIKKPQRTQRQNRTIHALFPDLATELNGLGIELAFGKFKASWTEITAKDFFKQCYLGGKKTSECTTRELADATNKVIKDINGLGGQLAIKDEALNNLLTQ